MLCCCVLCCVQVTTLSELQQLGMDNLDQEVSRPCWQAFGVASCICTMRDGVVSLWHDFLLSHVAKEALPVCFRSGVTHHFRSGRSVWVLSCVCCDVHRFRRWSSS